MNQLTLELTTAPATLAGSPLVQTFRQFAYSNGYDIEISHDRLRFPHGISKTQARRNHTAAAHHLNEALRAAADYDAAVASGNVRPPTPSEDHRARLTGHPDLGSVQAAWRVEVRRRRRCDPSLTEEGALASICSELGLSAGDGVPPNVRSGAA